MKYALTFVNKKKSNEACSQLFTSTADLSLAEVGERTAV